MENTKQWFRNNKVIIYVVLFAIGVVIVFISSAGWGAGFLGWHVILALALVCPFVCDLAKVGV